MGYCFAIIRIGIYSIVFLVFVVIGICVHGLFFMSPPKLLKWIAFFTQLWARVTCKVFNTQVRIEGDTSIKPGSLIVANHVGSPDIYVLSASFKGFFVSKSEIAEWPFLGWLVRLGKTVFADRSKRYQVKALIREIEQRLKSEQSVILFPEAQATEGKDVIPFKSAVFEAAVLADRPVVPIEIHYHDGHEPTIAFYGDSFIRHITELLKAPGLLATVTVLPQIPPGPERQALATKSYQAIRDRHDRWEA